MSELYEALCDMFIRPSKQQYSPYDLGCPLIGSLGKRKDFTITNTRNFKLQCSYYEPVAEPPSRCVIYLHSLNGCRLECTNFIDNAGIRLPEYFLKEGIAFASLDFTACGNSEGQYVSLGCHQTQDTLEFVEYLHHNYKIRSFALWGRSMGAVTAIKFAELYETDYANSPSQKWSLACIVADSPFVNLHKLALEIADKKINIPTFLVKAVFVFIKRTIQQKADFKFQQLDLAKCIGRLTTPIMILASKQDELISYRHSEEIFNGYGGRDKHLEYIDGNHNEYRAPELILKLTSYIVRRFDNLRKRQREASNEDGKRRLISVKSSTNSLFMLTQNKSYSALNCSSLTPTNKPSARKLSTEKLHDFRSAKNRQVPTPTKKKVDVTCFSEKIIPDSTLVNMPSESVDQIQLDEHAHYNIIHQKLSNMKKKGFLLVSPLQKKQGVTPQIKRKHTISLSKSPLQNRNILQEAAVPSSATSHEGVTTMLRSLQIKNAIVQSAHRGGNLLRYTKKPDLGNMSNRKQYSPAPVELTCAISTPTK